MLPVKLIGGILYLSTQSKIFTVWRVGKVQVERGDKKIIGAFLKIFFCFRHRGG